MSWKGWHGSSMSAVEELPIHTRVLALPRGKADLGWCPVITLGEGGHARFTYIHPQVIKPLVSQKEVLIGHVLRRGRHPPTHDLGWANPGVRAMQGRVVLDARWRGDGDGKRRGGKSCSGYCLFFGVALPATPNLWALSCSLRRAKEKSCVATTVHIAVWQLRTFCRAPSLAL